MTFTEVGNKIAFRLFAGLVLCFLLPMIVSVVGVLGVGIYAFMYDIWAGSANDVFLKLSSDENQLARRYLLRTLSVIGFLGGLLTNWDNAR